MVDKKGLVLCGGGARGGYHIGVWKALKEIGYTPSVITGTSVGALNGALITLGEEKTAENIWENMSMDTVFEKREDKDINTVKSTKEFWTSIASVKGLDPKPLKELVKKLADEEKFKNSNIEFGLVTTRLNPRRKVELFTDEIKKGQIADYILASASCFPIMKEHRIDNVDYIDGGYSDNIPFRMAMNRGATELVIVNMPSMFKLKKMEDVNAKVHYIFPKHDLGNFILFNKETGKRDIELGYLDTMKAFGRFEGNYYTFNKGAGRDADKYSQKCRELFSKVFSGLPNKGAFEELAMDNMLKCIKNYNKEIFIEESNVLNVLEMAATNYEVDYLKIYTFKELALKVMEEYVKTVETKEYEKLLSFDAIKEGIQNMEKLKKLLKSYDSKNIIAYLVKLLIKPKMTVAERTQLLAIGSVMSENLYSAIFIASYIK